MKYALLIFVLLSGMTALAEELEPLDLVGIDGIPFSEYSKELVQDEIVITVPWGNLSLNRQLDLIVAENPHVKFEVKWSYVWREKSVSVNLVGCEKAVRRVHERIYEIKL